jgi:hypothetical protein
MASDMAAGTGQDGVTVDMLRETFDHWRIGEAAGRWWAVRSGTVAADGPRSLVRPVVGAGTLEELAHQLCVQAWLASLSAGELEAIWRGQTAPAKP